MHGTAPVSGTFPTDEKLRLLGIGIQANQAFTISLGSRSAPFLVPGHDRCFTGMLLSPDVLSDPSKPLDPGILLRIPPS